MSFAYDQYLAEHIGNVNKGLHWMLDNLGFKEERPELEVALVNFDHDESKYSVEEYDAYDKYFYGGNRSYKVVQEFNYAWLHHIHNNPHHWQYWVLLEDDPESGLPYKALEIPIHVIFEMIADWWSFSWKSGNLFEIFNWYADHKDKQIINANSRRIIESILQQIRDILDREKEEATEYFDDHLEHLDTEDSDEGLYGIPEIKKYPMPDKKHVISAIRFFNYVDPKYEKELAEAILEKAEEFGLDLETDISVGNENRFKKYLKSHDDSVEHDGIKGMHWGHRRWQYYDGRYNDEGKRRYFGTKQPGLYDKANNKKEEKKKGYDPNVKSETSTKAVQIGGGGAGLTTYEDWEKELYKKMLESGENFDLSNMTEDQFKKLLATYGIKAGDDISGMLKKASTGYDTYKKFSTGGSGGSGGSGNAGSVISDKFGISQSSSKDKKSRSGSSGGSSGSGGSGKKAASDDSNAGKTYDASKQDNKKTEEEPEETEEAEETDKYADIMSKVYSAVEKKQSANAEYNSDDIFSDSDDTFVKNLEELTGEDLSDLTEAEINYLRKSIKNHYAEKTWEKTFQDKMDDILEKYPDSINKNSEFAKALKEFTGMHYGIMPEADIKKMRQKFVDYYLSQNEKKDEKEDNKE